MPKREVASVVADIGPFARYCDGVSDSLIRSVNIEAPEFPKNICTFDKSSYTRGSKNGDQHVIVTCKPSSALRKYVRTIRTMLEAAERNG